MKKMKTLAHVLIVLMAADGWWNVSWLTPVEDGMTLAVITYCETGTPYRAVTIFQLEAGEHARRVRQHYIPEDSTSCWVGAGLYAEGNDTTPLEWTMTKP